MRKSHTKRPFRIIDLMVLVAATAVAFAIDRRGMRPGMNFTTFRADWEPSVFYWMHRVTPFVAMWSFAVFVIDRFDSKNRRRGARYAGIVACYAVTAGLAVSSLISSSFYLLHVLEERQFVVGVLSHPREMHLPPPFGEAPLEEITGAVALGAWATLAAIRRWRIEPTWIDRLGRALGTIWISLLILYLYGYTG
jgi:hypothetical protein